MDSEAWPVVVYGVTELDPTEWLNWTELMKENDESEKVHLKLNIQKTKIMTSSPIGSWQIDGETMEKVERFYFSELQNNCRWWLQPWN